MQGNLTYQHQIRFKKGQRIAKVFQTKRAFLYSVLEKQLLLTSYQVKQAWP